MKRFSELKMKMNPGLLALFICTGFILLSLRGYAAPDEGRQFISKKITELQRQHSFEPFTNVFILTGTNSEEAISAVVRKYSLLQTGPGLQAILATQPDYIRLQVPAPDGQHFFHLLLYKQTISPGGLTILTGSGQVPENIPVMVNYRGRMEGNPESIAAFSFSQNEMMGLFSDKDGNYVLGKMENNPAGTHIVYNDKDLVPASNLSCATNTTIPVMPVNLQKGGVQAMSVNCVNWYWETDYDIFVGKGSVANVTTYVNGIFNQVSALYANDGMNIGLQTLFIWDVTDPYTGPSTSNYLTQFGNYRTSFAGDLANLLGYNGGGGVAWLNGFCAPNQFRMGYCGINSSYSSVPTYSWTVEVVAHEEGHLFGSPHTHDCAWNGNNTKIDACGDVAGYTVSGCPQTSPALPPAGGTIMSYCHLTGAGINFSNGFGPQPAALMLNEENTSPCLGSCIFCPVPPQPGVISGNTGPCQGTSQTYSISSVAGATSYTWTLPAGWSGSSTSTSITVTVGSTSGNVSVIANNACGGSPVRNETVNVSPVPSQPGSISGNSVPCPNTAYTYTVSPLAGAANYFWTLPAGWTGSSSTNSINVVTGTSGGTISVYASNACGTGPARNRTLSLGVIPPSPGSITVSGGGAKVCPGDSRTYSISQVNAAIAYTWTPPAGGTVSAGQGTTQATITYGSGFSVSDSLRVTADNSCGSSTPKAILIVRNNPVTPGNISGLKNSTCNLSAVPYSVTQVNGMTYNWSFNTGNATVTGGQGSNAITVDFAPAYTTGILSVSANNACGTSNAKTLTVKSTPATPGAISGAATVCQNQQGVPYAVSPVSGATVYTWSGPSGSRFSDGMTTSTTATFVTTSPSVTVNFKTTAGSIKVKAGNTCGYSSFKSKTVAFNCREGLATEGGQPTLEIAPNPVHEQLLISFLPTRPGNYSLRIMDMTGRVLNEQIGTSGSGIMNKKFDTTVLSPGIYQVALQTDAGITVKPFIVY